MSTLLTTPIQVPPKILKMQRIDGVYIDYVSKAISITVGSYEEIDSLEFSNIDAESFLLEEFVTPEYLAHFKFVFKAIREHAIAKGMIGAGVHGDDAVVTVVDAVSLIDEEVPDV